MILVKLFMSERSRVLFPLLIVNRLIKSETSFDRTRSVQELLGEVTNLIKSINK